MTEKYGWTVRWSWKELCGGDVDSLVVWSPVHEDLEPCFRWLCLELPVLCLLAIVSAYYSGLQMPRVCRPGRELLVLRCRTAACLALAALPVVSTYAEVYVYPGSLPPIRYLVSAVECMAWLVHSTYTVSLSGRAGRSLRGPSSLGVVWSLRLVLSWVSLRSVVVAPELTPPTPSILPLAFSITEVSLLTIYLLTLIPSQTIRSSSILSTQDEARAPLLGGYSSFRHHFDQSDILGVAGDPSWGILSRLSFSWVTPLLRKGQQGELETNDDLFELPTSLTPWYLYLKLRSALTEESLYGSRRATLVTALHRCFWKQFYSVGLLRLVADISGFASPLLLHALVSFVQDPEQPPYHGYLYAAGLTAASLISGVCLAHFNYQMTKVGLKMRGALITTIYRKILTANSITLSQISQGEILNMMSTDVDRIVNSCPSFHAFWSIPFQLGVSLYLLYSQVGVSFLAGVAFSLLLIPINRAIASKIGDLSTKMMESKDERLMLMTELLRGIKAIKLYAWETVLSKRINNVREKELKFLGGRKYLDALCVYFWATTPVLISILTFSIYVYTGHTLTAPLVFTTMALLNMLIAPLNSFPWVLNGLVEAWVSLKRLEKLIELPEMELDEYYSTDVNMSSGDNRAGLLPGELVIVDGFFSWSDSANFSLSAINFHIRPGQFVGVTGPVGSGKSSLLLAILAEMNKSSGTVSVGDYESGIGYVAQSTWLQRGSIRSNILFGEAFDHNIYCKVLEACCLLEDLKILPGGDEASVGEGGSSLSGGQRARVALARAVYKDHNLYLLDDVLSGVDAEVAAHILRSCVGGLLKNRTRLLCTHQSKFLVHADWVIVMKGGRIFAQGVPAEVLPDYDEIMANNELESEKSSNYEGRLGCREEDESYPPSVAPEEQIEEKSTGLLETGVYTMYLKAVGIFLVIAILTFVTLMQGSRNAVDWWMAFWVSSLNDTNTTFPKSTLTDAISDYTGESSEEEKTWFYLTVYLGLAGVNSIATLARAFLFAYGGLVAARSVHDSLVSTVLSAKLWLFDVTPVGRLLNRFSSDTYTVDDSLPFIVNILLAQVFTLAGTVAMTVYGLPWLMLVLAPLVPIYHWIQDHYRKTSREIKRLTSASLSPLYTHFTESIQGLVTVRAFKSSSRLKRDNTCLLEASQKAQLCAGALAQWLGLRLQLIGVVLVCGVGVLAAVQHHLDHAIPGLVGLALSYALTVSGSLSGVVNAFTETERELVSVERIRSYLVGSARQGLSRPQTPSLLQQVPFGWPQFGVVSFNSVFLKYRWRGTRSKEVTRGILAILLLATTSGVVSSSDPSCLDQGTLKDHCRCNVVASVITCCGVNTTFKMKESLNCIPLANVTSVIIKNSTLEELDASHPVFSHVQVFNLTNSSVSRISGRFQGDILHTLGLSSLGLLEIDDRAFSSLTRLRYLDLSRNNLTELPKIPLRDHLTLDLSNNSQLLCDSLKELMRSWKPSSPNMLNPNQTYCSTSRSFNWFNATHLFSLSQLEMTSNLEYDCPKGEDYMCRCSVGKLDLVAGKAPTNSIKVDCSGLGLTSLPPRIPPNTYMLNVSDNYIVSLDPFVTNPGYSSIRELWADNNKIDSISGLEGTQFIVNFMVLSLRGNRLKNIPTYFLSSTFDRTTYLRTVKLGNNRLECNCTTATTLTTFLKTHELHIPDYTEVYCQGDGSPVVSLKPEVMCISYIPKKWTDYIYYIIAGEIFLLAALVSKVSYDYWVFKSTGSLPWPASRMPKLPCDWVFE